MLAVWLALVSALLFGAMTVLLRLALRTTNDIELGTVVTTAVAFAVALAAVPLASGDLGGAADLGFFALAGLLAPGVSQLLFTRAVRDAGPSRTSVVVGSAPLFAAAMAIVFLEEPLRAPLAVGAFLIVLAGVFLATERGRPAHVKAGIAAALLATILFSARDNLVRWYSGESRTGSVAAAAAAMAAAFLVMLALAALRRRGALPSALRAFPARYFALAGVAFGLSYVLLFEAYYRGRVTVVSPLVATESLWGVFFSALLFRRSDVVGPRLVGGACLVVGGGVLISVYR